MTSDLEKSFKSKLRAIAKEKNRDPADLWQTLTLERFLVRLDKSEYRKHFVLKGGILLSKYIEIGRETTDLDFLAKKISYEVNNLKIVFEKIASIDIQDGFLFKEMNRLQNFWNEYLRNLRAENLASLPEKIADVIATINNWLQLNTGIIGS
jgi:hypothetical protein